MAGYIDDYLYYGSGTECPDSFNLWSALTLLGAVVGRKVWYKHGDYFHIYPNLYTCLVGTPGSGKSTAKGQVKNLMVKYFPQYMLSDSIQTREDIAKKMGTPECEHSWQDIRGDLGEPGKVLSYRPFFIIANELSNFVSVDKGNMVNFLVDIFDENHFSTGFKNTLSQRFTDPHVSLLACCPPEWIMSNLRADLFVGGLGRRLIIVHDKKKRLVHEPTFPAGAIDALGRAVQYLQEAYAATTYGQFRKSAIATTWWKEWYHDPKRFNREDPILIQFHETKHVMLMKVAMLHALSRNLTNREITDENFVWGLGQITALEPEICLLTGGIGRNEIAGVGVQLLDHIRRLGGAVPEVVLMKSYHRYLRDPEFMELMNHYASTGQITVVANKEGKRMWMLPERYQELVKEQAATAPPPVPPG